MLEGFDPRLVEVYKSDRLSLHTQNPGSVLPLVY